MAKLDQSELDNLIDDYELSPADNTPEDGVEVESDLINEGKEEKKEIKFQSLIDKYLTYKERKNKYGADKPAEELIELLGSKIQKKLKDAKGDKDKESIQKDLDEYNENKDRLDKALQEQERAFEKELPKYKDWKNLDNKQLDKLASDLGVHGFQNSDRPFSVKTDIGYNGSSIAPAKVKEFNEEVANHQMPFDDDDIAEVNELRKSKLLGPLSKEHLTRNPGPKDSWDKSWKQWTYKGHKVPAWYDLDNLERLEEIDLGDKRGNEWLLGMKGKDYDHWKDYIKEYGRDEDITDFKQYPSLIRKTIKNEFWDFLGGKIAELKKNKKNKKEYESLEYSGTNSPYAQKYLKEFVQTWKPSKRFKDFYNLAGHEPTVKEYLQELKNDIPETDKKIGEKIKKVQKQLDDLPEGVALTPEAEKALDPLLNRHWINQLGFTPGDKTLSEATEERLIEADDEEELGDVEAFEEAIKRHHNYNGKETKKSFGKEPNKAKHKSWDKLVEDADNEGVWFKGFTTEAPTEKGKADKAKLESKLKELRQQAKETPEAKQNQQRRNELDELMAYLDKHYPEEPVEEQLEDLAEKEPEVAKKAKKVIPEVAKEAEQITNDSDKRNDEVNNEAVKKDVADIGKNFIKANGMLNSKVADVERPITPGQDYAMGMLDKEKEEEKLSNGFEDGMLKRDAVQQAEFDRIKQQSEAEAAQWRADMANRANQMAQNAQPVSTPMPQTNQIPEASAPEVQEGQPLTQGANQPVEQPNPDVLNAQVNEEMNRFSGSKKNKGKGSIEDLEALEFKPEEFNKQYEIEHPEQAIKDELSEDELNDMEYKPSQEELDMLNKANRAEWEANGRPRNKDIIDKTIGDTLGQSQKAAEDAMNEEVEEEIENNPEAAEKVAEESVGEGNPIEEEAEQAADPSGHDNEVNNEAIDEASVGDKTKFLERMGEIPEDTDINSYPESRQQYEPGEQFTPEFNPNPDVVDYGIEEMPGQEGVVPPKEWDPDETMYDPDSENAPELEIEEIPEEELRKIFDPLNKEIEARSANLSKAKEALDLAQRHFDENPSEENAKALQKADQAYKDAEYLLNNKKEEFNEAYKNLGNYYQPTKEEEPEGFIKEVQEDEKEEPELTKLPKGVTPKHFSSSMSGSAQLPTSFNQNRTPGMSFGNAFRGGSTLGGLGITAGHPGSTTINKPQAPAINRPMATKAPVPKAAQVTPQKSHAPSAGFKQNNGPFGSGGVTKHGNSLIQAFKASLPNGFANNQPDQFAGGSTTGGSTNKTSGLRQTFLAQLEARIKQLPKDVQEHFHFSTKYKHVEYKEQPLEELDGGQLEEVEHILEVLGV